jgi:polysaccharide export outer membrane protein
MAAVLYGLVVVVLPGCGPKQAVIAPVGGLVAPTQDAPEYRIQPGDQLDIKFFYNPELNEAVLVRSDGKISLQLIDDIQAAGLTPAELDQELTRLYAQELRKPVITVLVRASTGHRIYVGGEVGTPGLLTLVPRMTALQAVINAGGFRETARPGAVIVIRKGSDTRAVPIRVDLNPSLDGESAAGDIPLEPSDIVYVPKTFIAEANLFVNQYIERLLLYRGISLGFAYNINPEFR